MQKTRSRQDGLHNNMKNKRVIRFISVYLQRKQLTLFFVLVFSFRFLDFYFY
jgi:hypothetical protein